MIGCVAEYYGSNAIYSYVTGLCFNYTRKAVVEAPLLDVYRIVCLPKGLRYLTDCLNIDVQVYYPIRKNDIDLLLKKNLACGPVGVNVDAYYCSWNTEYYQRYRMPHYFLLTQADKQRDIIACADGYIFPEIKEASYQSLIPHINALLCFRQGREATEPGLHTICNNVKKEIVVNEQYTICHQIEMFANDILNHHFSEKEKFLFKDLMHSQFIFSSAMVHDSRMRFSLLFAYLYERFGYSELQEICKAASASAKKWKVVFNLIIKAFYSCAEKTALDSAHTTLLEIADEECGIIDAVIALQEKTRSIGSVDTIGF